MDVVPSHELKPRLRVLRRGAIALGPGKADLLQAIDERGSIRDAAGALQMSYMRAWTLVQTMNGCFRQPLVDAGRGGARRGGARLTATGRRALRLYRAMEHAARRVARPSWNELRKLLKP